MAEETQLVGADAIAAKYRVTVPWVRWAARTELIPSVCRNRVYLFDPVAVEDRLVEVANLRPDHFKPLQLIGMGEMLKRIGLSKRHFPRLVEEGVIPHFKHGNVRLFNPDAVHAILWQIECEMLRPKNVRFKKSWTTKPPEGTVPPTGMVAGAVHAVVNEAAPQGGAE